MKKLMLFILVCFLSLGIKAQIGVHFKTISTKGSEWNRIISLDLLNQEKVFAFGVEYGVDWWLRLKKYRIEWTPEFSYGKAESNYVTRGGNQRTYKLQTLNFILNNNIYIFDLKEPDCPRYGLQGDIFKKGFFLQISPGITQFKQDFSIEGSQVETKTTTFKVGIGAGMDFVIGNIISITPYVKMNFYPLVEWDQLRETHAAGSAQITTASSPVNQIQVGIRIGLRPKILRD
jgi:hypothetical protein